MKWGDFYTKPTFTYNCFYIKHQTFAQGLKNYFHKSVYCRTDESKIVNGFYDGNGVYKVHFMPSFEEKYKLEVSGTFSDRVYSGEFTVTAPQKENYGSVKVSDTIFILGLL